MWPLRKCMIFALRPELVRIDLAKEIDRQLNALHKKLFVEANPIAVKWALAEMGLVDQGIRLPLTWLSSLYHEQVRDALRQAEV